MAQDNSKHIFNTFYKKEGRILKVYLKNGDVLEGTFIGYFHGDEESGDPFIIKWHFLPVADPGNIPKVPVLELDNGSAFMIMNRDIVNVEFR